MENRIRLSIPQPCSEKWESFAPTSNGGFCGSCQKTVIDFTKMTDAEVMQFLKTKPAHTCGRLRADQLKEYSNTPLYNIRPSRMLLKAAFVSLLLAVISKPTFAQTPTEPAKTEMVKSNQSNTGSFVVKGIVNDEENLPIPGTNVVLLGSSTGTTTDENGKFEFPVPLKGGDRLVFSFIGCVTQEYVIDATSSNMQVTLAPDVVMLGEVMPVMMGAIAATEPELPKKPVKTWFASIRSWF